MNNAHILGTERIGKLLVQYSIPAIIGMTITSLYNIIDSIFICLLYTSPSPRDTR